MVVVARVRYCKPGSVQKSMHQFQFIDIWQNEPLFGKILISAPISGLLCTAVCVFFCYAMQSIVYTYICHSFIIRHEEGMRVLNNKYVPMICPTFGTLENHKRIYVYCNFSFLCPVLCCIIYITQHKTIRHDTTQNGIVYFSFLKKN